MTELSDTKWHNIHILFVVMHFRFGEITWNKFKSKGSYTVVWDRYAYLLVAEKELGVRNIYRDISFNKKLIRDYYQKVTDDFLITPGGIEVK